MQKDCHYTGTYYVARMAGFSPEEAQHIAWAAQTVDECHIDNLKSILKKATESNLLREFEECFLLTILGTFEDCRHIFSINELKENGDATSHLSLTAIRSIWMPFHFLPGNWNKALKYNEIIYYHGLDDEFLSPSNPDYLQNMHDWALMCRTCSETCWVIVQNAKKQYQEWKNVNKSFALSAVGIAMHVLADTWSHELFVGSPNKQINYAKPDALSTYVSKDANTSIIADVSMSDYTYEVTGHGTAGSAPDIPYLDGRYALRHAFMEKCAVKSKTRNNKVRFLNGFAQMLLSLRYITNDSASEKDAAYKKEILYLYQKATEELSEVKKLFDTKRKVSFFTDSITKLQHTFLPDEEVGIKLWKDLIYRTYHEDLPDYVFCPEDDYGREDLYKVINFMQAAKKHRESVITFVEKSLGWRDVFSFQASSREKPYDADECVRRFFNMMNRGTQRIIPYNDLVRK